ncbi:MAG: glutamine-hydrolyzing GMP synthase [Candidatus Theseobacter exili]|nr:glutamine-hydrolyzing GMP synthase [Candidatus Theseobacter exili]
MGKSQHFEKDLILILDFGSQYNQLIARRVREQQVYCRLLPYKTSLEEIKKLGPKGIIMSGGPSSVYEPDAPQCDPAIFSLNIPILGICYGMQLMIKQLGGKIYGSSKREYGKSELTINDACAIFDGIPNCTIVWMSHGDSASELPKGFRQIGNTSNSQHAAVANIGKGLYGFQFHPEVVHSREGNKMIGNFLFSICRCSGDWTMKSFIESSLEKIRIQVGEERVILGLSGGVDSSVAAVLLHEAIGDQLTCVFINNGLLRRDEAEKVNRVFREHFKINLHYADRSDYFLNALEGITDPERKRKVIGEKFIRVFEEEMLKIGDAKFLAQGTLYPDVIESVSAKGGPSATIKSHHNVGGLPDDLKFELVEPLRDLFKDEVRELGRELRMHDDIVMRQPFPGPGLAIRIIGNVTKERLEVLKEADCIVVDEIKKEGLYKEIWQSFAVLLPVKSVGVMGDERTYENTIALRAVTSLDGMTADWVRLPYEVLERISNRIINEVRGVNRVVYDISSKPPSTIEWE